MGRGVMSRNALSLARDVARRGGEGRRRRKGGRGEGGEGGRGRSEKLAASQEGVVEMGVKAKN